jgi:hypothetical protein
MKALLFKSLPELALAWFLVVLGFVTILGSPALMLSLFPVGWRWIDYPCVGDYREPSEVALRAMPFLIGGIISVFGGVALRQRCRLET